MRAFAIVILMGLNLAAVLLLEAKLGIFYWIEALAILCALAIISVQFLAMWLDADWAYPMATILFSLSLVNLLVLYQYVPWFKVFAVGIVVNLLGIVVSCIGGSKCDEDDSDDLETYDEEEYEEEKPKRGRKRK